MAELVVEIGKGKWIASSSVMVKDVVSNWLKKYRSGHKESTNYNAECLLKAHVLSLFGDMPVSSLTPLHVNNMIIEMLDKGLKPRTVIYVRWLLKSVLNDALSQNLVKSNIAEQVKPPRDIRKEVQPITDDQARIFMKAARENRLRAAFVVALGTGLRRGEILGLRWCDIDFEGRVLYVRRSYSKQRGKADFTDGKTYNALRPVPVSDTVLQALREHKAQQDEERKLAGDRWQESGLVFTTDVGTPVDPDNFRKEYLLPILKKAGLHGIHMQMVLAFTSGWALGCLMASPSRSQRSWR